MVVCVLKKTFNNISPLVGTPTGVEKLIKIIVTVVGVPTNNINNF